MIRVLRHFQQHQVLDGALRGRSLITSAQMFPTDSQCFPLSSLFSKWKKYHIELCQGCKEAGDPRGLVLGRVDANAEGRVSGEISVVLHDFITGQARAMYAAAAESTWDHIREWATREAVHPWKIPQLKVILDNPP
ncbi:hypothetical protein J6590_098753 [Homalodisca vitripennis]|nr:hypothetical protein J6590_098753 [Homalodisca vitripennis]